MRYEDRNNALRQRVKMLKAQKDIPYKDIAERLGIKQRSIYSWLRNRYNFSAFSLMILEEILEELE